MIETERVLPKILGTGNAVFFLKCWYQKTVKQKWNVAWTYLSVFCTPSEGSLLKLTRHSMAIITVQASAIQNQILLCTDQLFVSFGGKQFVEIRSIGNLYFDHPAFSVWISVDSFRIGFKMVVKFDNLTSHRKKQI